MTDLPGMAGPSVETSARPESEHAPDGRAVRAPRRPSDRFQREAPRRIRHRLATGLASAASRIVSLIPNRLRDGIADLIGMVWIRMTPTYRANVMANASQILGPAVSEHELEAIARGVFKISARNFGELLRVRHLSHRQLAALVPLSDSDLAALHEARKRGQGVVIATAHMGAFDLLGHAIGANGVPLTVITGRTTSRFLFDAVTHLRNGHNCMMVEPTPAGVRHVIRALRRGEAAGFVSDYDFFQNGVPVTFFGRETTLPPGPIRIARDTGALVVPMFPYREDGRHRLRVGAPFEVPKTANVDADVAAGMEILKARLEEGIGATPRQWVLFQRAWPLEPAPPIRVFPVGSPLAGELSKRVEAVLPPSHESIEGSQK